MEWLADHLEQTYGIAVDGISKPQAWNPYVLRVDRRDGEAWIARVFDDRRGVDRAEGDAAILRWLSDVGYPAERCAADAPVSTRDGRAVLVTDFVQGVPATRTGSDLEAIGERLGRLHSLEGMPDACRRDGGAWHGDPAFEGAPAQDLAHASVLVDRIADRVPPHLQARVDDLRVRLDGADDCADLPHSLVHPDPAPVNAVATDDGLVLIDWTGAGVGPRVTSLAIVLFTGARHVAAGYRRHVELESGELERLGAALRIRSLFWSAFYLHLSLSTGSTPTGTEEWWPDDAIVEAVADRARAVLA